MKTDSGQDPDGDYSCYNEDCDVEYFDEDGAMS
jgi:hypothetical protein